MAASRRRHGQGSIIHRPGTDILYIQYRRDGETIRESAKTKLRSEAEAILRERMVGASRGEALPSDLRKVKYEDLRETYLSDYERRGHKSLKNGVTPGLSMLDQFFHGKTVAKITVDSIDEFKEQRQAEFAEARKEDEYAGNASINRSLAALRRMFTLYKQRYPNKIGHIPHMGYLPEPPARTGFLSQEHFNEILEELPVNLHPLVLLLYITGVRGNEAKQITWAQVELHQDKALIHLTGQQTKNKNARVLPIRNARLLKLLEEMKSREGIVFDATNLRAEWTKACKKVGVEGVLIHDLRRSAVRNLRKAGVSEGDAMKITGHKDRKVFDRYDVRDTDDLIESMDKLENGHSEASEVQQLRARLAQLEAQSRKRLPA
ncbi:MAG: site-specific integrase [Candidatus Acidiferrales bacterium]